MPADHIKHGATWANWLRLTLGERTAKYLVERSDGQISYDAVNRWTSGNRPRPDKVILVADILGANRATALTAAGYPELAATAGELPADPLVEEIKNLPISDESKQALLDLRDRRLEELRADVRKFASLLPETHDEDPETTTPRTAADGG